MIGLTPIYAQSVFGDLNLGWEAIYAFLETGVGLGNLIGGFVIGLIGVRFAKGRMVIAGYTAFGPRDVPPRDDRASRDRARRHLRVWGREHGLRHPEPDAVPGTDAAVAHRARRRASGSRWCSVPMNLSIALGGILAEVVGVTPVMAMFGLITMAAGLAGLLFPAVRDA